MKVVSLVPSWTEMLLEAKVNVVGRTRFCIHPQAEIARIPIVGGTKDLDMNQLRALDADCLILDQEENLPWMKERSPIPVCVSHVTAVADLAAEIEKIAQVLSSPELRTSADRWRAVAQSPPLVWDWNRIPGELFRLRKDRDQYENLLYLIWKNPWMSVSKATFIGSILQKLGASSYLPDFMDKYPQIQMENFDRETTYFLFSSEPFPFHKKREDLLHLGVQGSVVDGESFSWFGSRALRFLETAYSSATY